VDGAAPGPALVFGSLPPGARDLDLLVRDADAEAFRAALAAAGFARKGGEFARFAGCTAEAVELSPASEWELPPVELDELFAQARPVGDLRNLVRPSPHHDLLVLAKLLAWSGSFPEKRRARLEQALSDDPGAWETAARHAAAWNVGRELELLRTGTAPAPGASRRPKRPRVVALSGVDGSGKSTQARALRDALVALGHDAAIEWAPLSQNAWLEHVARPVKALLRRSRRGTPPPEPEETGLHRDEGTELRQRSALVRFGWTTLVALANASWQTRMTARHTLAGRVVIFDRHFLDTAARMRFQYGGEHAFRFQNFLVRRLSPKPRVAFFLDIGAEESLARKDDRWTAADLEQQVRFYREEAERLDVIRLDGTRPQEELCAEIAEAVWRALA
jgi:thymidylate kinase